jgi:glycosyltransferase involved in cell wall biosynthesis
MRASIERLARKLGIQKRLRWLGNIPDVRPLLAVSDVTVLASTAVETFSIAMLESLAMRTPMIAPLIGGLSEAIADGKSGWLFPAGDQVALSDKMRTAMAVNVSLEKMGDSGRDSILRDFTVEKMVIESESVLMQSWSAA